MTAPNELGFYLFRGSRKVRDTLYERLAEPVQIVEVWSHGKPELAIAMLGRQQRFRVDAFEGTWVPIGTEPT